MPRLVGLAYASVLYRQVDELKQFTNFSNNGNEVAWGTIGNASAAEGMFWEAINAMGVLNAPVVMSIWDDGYGISVPNKFQHTKDNVGELLLGFQRKPGGDSGYEIFTVRAWDYAALVDTYAQAAKIAREEHVPVIVHVIDVTQPQGHSTSGSHERYKSKERLQWEDDFDGIKRMREWMVAHDVATAEEMDAIESKAFGHAGPIDPPDDVGELGRLAQHRTRHAKTCGIDARLTNRCLALEIQNHCRQIRIVQRHIRAGDDGARPRGHWIE